MMKNASYFMLKALFVLEIFTFCQDFFGHVKNGFLRKLRLISKFMISETGQRTITIDVLPNISKSKDNQSMNFGQLIEYNIRNNFFKKSYTKWGREASPRLFYKNSK